jgi:uncharacterized protein (TIGR03435 family)
MLDVTRMNPNILLFFACYTAFAQNAGIPAFDLASIKPSTAQYGSYMRYLPGGRFSGMTWIKQLIQTAYDVADYQVSGGPEWTRSDRYEIEAKAADPNAGTHEMKRMLQTLLTDRFKLKVRRETKEFAVYGLVVDKNGPKLKPLKPGEPGTCTRENSEICGIRTTAQLANWLRSITGRPVLDQTKIDGNFDVLLTFDIYELRNQTAPPDYNKAPLQVAIREQLGLRLEPQKASFPMIVVEDIQRPTEN